MCISIRSLICLPAVLRTLLLFAAMGALNTPPVFAHVDLQSSQPADGDTLQVSLEQISLRFTGAVLTQYTSATLIGPDGRPIATSELQAVAESSGREFVLPIDTALWSGEYTVRWRTSGEDGHLIEGSFTFVIDVDQELVTHEQSFEREADTTAHHPEQVGRSALLASTAPLSIAIRFFHYIPLVVLLGAVAFHYGVIGRMRRDARVAHLTRAASRRNIQAMTAALALLGVAMIARLWAQSGRLHGVEEALDPGNLATMLSLTTWGYGWLLQVAGGSVFLIGLLLVRPAGQRAAGWPVAAVGVLSLSIVPALSGHAASVDEWLAVAIIVHTLHVIGAGVWLGTLAILVLVGLPSALAAQQGDRISATASMVRLFSPVALAGGALAGLTGIANALFHFDAISGMWTTDYGIALLVKLCALVIAFGFGFYHWRVVLPDLDEDATHGRFRRTARAELAAGVAVLLVTAVFVVLPTQG